MPRMKKHEDYLDTLLKNEEEAVAYLNAALEEDDTVAFLVALRYVVRARGITMEDLASRADLNRVSLQRMLSEKGNPEFINIRRIMHQLGFKISIQLESIAV